LFKLLCASIDKGMTIVVGAGLAGLTCAKVLAQAGRRFVKCVVEHGHGAQRGTNAEKHYCGDGDTE
jgi:predicted NAD/FAD-dependent oxidoreductase